MAKRKSYQTLAEAIEAGEPHLVDKITGEIHIKTIYPISLDTPGYLIVEKGYRTISGAFIILARPETKEEEEAYAERKRSEELHRKKAEQERIKKVLDLSGYILIGWKQNSLTRIEDSTAYYIQATGPRYVYTKPFYFTWEKDSKGYKCLRSATLGFYTNHKLTRKGREKIARQIRSNTEEYSLCAPLWLLTSIPDPRPRFLAGETGEVITPHPSIWGNTATC